jgi:threonine dehydrogenase-like Zn-dependent dehydrogenase
MSLRVAFTASEYQADGSIARVPYELSGSSTSGWSVLRAGVSHVEMGSGYRLLRVSHCGICATDLARRHLPFRLPQITGHEVVAVEEDGTPVVVEINASHRARALRVSCAYCDGGLPSHCPERLVLGIHDLPGGFGPWLLAPVNAILPLPASVSPRVGSFVEPFAAALHAARIVTRVPRGRIAVLGPGRLGLLVIAALSAWRRRAGGSWEIVALPRRPERAALARRLGADDVRDPSAVDAAFADVVVDTTGSPAGFERALELAREEVHLKTTCGEPSAGLRQATSMVVDEVALFGSAALPLQSPAGGPKFETLLVMEGTPTVVRDELMTRGLRVVARSALPSIPFGAADVVTVPSMAEVDDAIRPNPSMQRGLVRPRGVVVVAEGKERPLGDAVLHRGVVVTTSRCGDFRAALDLLPDVPDLAAELVTTIFPTDRLADAFTAAAAADQLKVIVTQDESQFA